MKMMLQRALRMSEGNMNLKDDERNWSTDDWSEYESLVEWFERRAEGEIPQESVE